MKRHTYQIRAREITGAWPTRASKCQDQPDRVIHIFDADVLRVRLGSYSPSEAFYHATTATIYLRHTEATCYAVARVHPYDPETGDYRGGVNVYFGQASGHGYDRTAASLAGMPIGTAIGLDGKRHPVILTDHGELQYTDHPFDPTFREFQVHAGSDRNLPRNLVIVS